MRSFLLSHSSIIVLISMCTLSPITTAAAAERQASPWRWSLSGGAVHQFETDLADTAGEFSVSRGFIQGGLSYAWNRRSSVSLSLGAGTSNYEFSPEATIDGEQPWEQIRDYRLSLPVRFSPADRMDVLVVPSIRSYAEANAGVGDGRTEGLLTGFGWRFSPSLTLGPGFGWFSRLGGGSIAFPILVIDWKIAEKWRLSTGRGMAASQGPGLTLNYQLAEQWTLGLAGRFERTRFALEARDSRSEGIGEERSLPLILQLNFSPAPMTSLTALVGVEFDGSLKLEDSSGQTIARTDFETAPVIGVAFSSRF